MLLGVFLCFLLAAAPWLGADTATANETSRANEESEIVGTNFVTVESGVRCN